MNLFLAGLMGLIAAFPVNYLADVLPWKDGRLGKALCGRCGGALGWGEYLRWWKPCPHCGKARWRHGIVLVSLTVLSALLWIYPGKWGFWAMWVLLVYAMLVAVIDAEHRLILHVVSATGALLLGGLGIWRHGLEATLLGGAAGASIMLLLFLLGNGYAYLKARRANQPPPTEPALGFGDVALSTDLGLLLGWPGILAGLTFAILVAGAFSLLFLLYALLRWHRLRTDAYIPYAPFLLLGALLAIYV